MTLVAQASVSCELPNKKNRFPGSQWNDEHLCNERKATPSSRHEWSA